MNEKSIIKYASIVGVIYLFLSFNPFVLWLLPAIATFSAISILTFLIFYLFLINRMLVVSIQRFFFICSFMLFATYITLHLPSRDFLWWKFVYFIPFFFILFFPHEVFVRIFLLFRKVIIFFSILAIILFVLLLFGVDLPYHRIDLRPTSYFKIYGLVVSSSNTIYQFMGFTIARACGPFLEPGHFGIYIGVTLAIERIYLKKISRIPVIAGLLTFSPAFLLIFMLLIFYDIIIQRKIKLLLFSAFFVITLFSVVLTNKYLREGLYYITIGRNQTATGDFELDSRVASYASLAWNAYIERGNILFGKGFRSLDKIGALSDYRGVVYRFGIVGFIWTLLLIFYFLTNYNRRTLFLMLPIIILVFAHRAWMFDSAYFYIFLHIVLSMGKLRAKEEKKLVLK